MGLLQMSVQGAAMILAVVAVRTLFLNKLPKGVFMLLWAIVMVRLLVPFDVPLPVSAWSIAERAATQGAVEEPAAPPTALEGSPQLAEVNAYAAQLAASYVPAESGQAASVAPSVQLGQVVSDAAATPAADTPGILASLYAWAVEVNLPLILWAVGIALIAVYFVLQYAHGLSDFRWSVPARHPFAQEWLEHHPLRRRITIRVHDTLTSPMTYGLFKPVILVPRSFDWDDRGSASYMLMHEWVHVWRWDAVYKLFLTATLVLHWFNPLVWVMFFLANRDIELACDEHVVRLLGPGGRKAYAHTLIDMAERNGALAPLASGFGKSAIEERIVAIVNVKRMTGAAGLATVVLAAGITVAFAASPAPIDEEPGAGEANPGSFVQAAAGGQTEQVSYEAYMERGYGATRVVTPWYSVMLEDALFAQGFSYEYDEAGLGFYSSGATEACSVLRVFDRATGELAYLVYLASGETPGEAPFEGDYAVARGGQIYGGGYTMVVARPYDVTSASSFERALAQAQALRDRLSADTATHLVRDAAAGATVIKTAQYSVTVPDDLLGLGWTYTYDAELRDELGTGSLLGGHLRLVPAGGSEATYGVYLSNGAFLEGEYATGTVHTFGAESTWEGYSVVAYRPFNPAARSFEAELDALTPFARTVEAGEDAQTKAPQAEVFSLWEDGDLRIVTPYYSTLVPGELVGAGFDYLYVEGLPAAEAAEAEFFRSHITEIYLERSTERVAWYDVYCYSEGVERGGEGLVQAAVDLVSPDALSIGVDVAAGSDAARDRSDAEAYALTVRLAQASRVSKLQPGMVDGKLASATQRDALVELAEE